MSRLPAVRAGQLTEPSADILVDVGTAAWFAWLGTARSFTFAGQGGTFTARQEERSGHPFWYAYRHAGRRLHKVYLGRSAELTVAQMEAAARTLTEREQRPQQDASPAEATVPLMATKIAMPQPSQALVERPDVMARCLEGLERTGTIIAAPAGFGKTTVLIAASGQMKARGWPVAWVTLEEAERDPIRFWRYVLDALDVAQPSISSGARRLMASPRLPAIEHILTLLINACANLPTPLALVLDDYHRAATPENDQALAFLIEHAPSQLRLLVATRHTPTFALPRLWAQGRITVLHAVDLRFSLEDAGRFLRETMHLTLAPEQVRQLDQHTEGWVAGLQLAALALRDHPGLTAPAPDLAPSAYMTEYLAEYLIAEVVQRQPSDVQAFLLQTSILERLTGPLCDALTGRTDSATLLVTLMQAQLFVTPLDLGQNWYRYHHVFAEVLRARLARTESELVETCHKRAAAWLQQQGLVSEAIQHLIAASALDEAATLIEGESDRLILRGEVAGLSALAEALPRPIILQHPHLAVLWATGLVLQSESGRAAELLAELEQLLLAEDRLVEAIAGEMNAVRAFLRIMESDFVGAASLAHQAIEQLPPDEPVLRAVALLLINIMGILGGQNLLVVSQSMAKIVHESLRANNILVAYIALITRASVELIQGRLHRTTQTCHEALRLATGANGEEVPLMVMAYCVLGEIKREWNDLAGAETIIRHAMELGLYPNNSEFLMDGLISLAMIQAERGQAAEALASFAEIRQLIQTQRLAKMDLDQVAVMEVRALILLGHNSEAAHWAAERRQNSGDGVPWMDFPFMRETEDLTLARVALAQGQAQTVIPVLEGIRAQAEAEGRRRNVLEATILLARAHAAMGAPDAALRALEAALTIAAPEGYLRIFLDEGESLADVLATYVACQPSLRERAYALKLLTAFGRTIAPPTESLIETLSPRELEVLHQLAAGHSNEAIARDLVVALSTVKWHVARIYRKLGVAGRVQAVARARALHLLT